MAEEHHIQELPELVAHEHWPSRLAWIFIGGIVLFLTAKLMSHCWEQVVDSIDQSVHYNLEDRWHSESSHVVLDIVGAKSPTMRLLIKGDDYDLKVGRASKETLAEGDVHCHKNAYVVGTFKLQKQPGNLNELLLIVTYEDNRIETFNLTRSR